MQGFSDLTNGCAISGAVSHRLCFYFWRIILDHHTLVCLGKLHVRFGVSQGSINGYVVIY